MSYILILNANKNSLITAAKYAYFLCEFKLGTLYTINMKQIVAFLKFRE